MAEKIKHEKSNENIKEDLLELKLKSYHVSGLDSKESKQITKAFNKENGLLKDKILPFFYTEYLDKAIELGTIKNEDMSNYFKGLKHNVSMAYDIPAKLEELNDFIDTLDKPADMTARKKLQRYKKLKRLEEFYDILIKFTLTVIHHYFWKDITLGVDLGAGVSNPKHRIKQLLPLMNYIKNFFEAEIEKDFKKDNFEKELSKF